MIEGFYNLRAECSGVIRVAGLNGLRCNTKYWSWALGLVARDHSTMSGQFYCLF